MRLLIFILLILSGLVTQGQDNCHMRISLLTASPGEDLYSTFGHSALRITDSVNHTDVVYNYGTFNFEEPNFYTKFIKGKLLYSLSTEDFDSFIPSYKDEQRGITEQVLNLSCIEKLKMAYLLRRNLEGSNRYYKYDFLFDNCTTRLRDLLEKSADSGVHYTPVVKEKTTYRQLIYVYLNRGDKQWSKLGIDLLLGSRTDAIMNNRQVMFLPDYLMYSFDSSTIGSRPTVSEKKQVYSISPGPESNTWLDPMLVFVALLILMVGLGIRKQRKDMVESQTFRSRFLTTLDALIFFTTGLASLMMLFMWFGTEHLMCSDNYNLLWAWPTHVIAAFFIPGRRTWARIYFLISAAANVVVLALWFFLPQHFNIALLPFVALLAYRGFSIYNSPNKHLHASNIIQK